jgi:hypothetical protein
LADPRVFANGLTMRGARILITAAFCLAGCMTPTTPTQRLADSANEMNTATRFGRMDIALEHVGATARDEFMRQHSAWGRGLRIVDVEVQGMNMLEQSEADVFLSVSWQRADEAQVRVTHVSQRWRDDRGWRVTKEERKGGDFGLLGEATLVLEPPRTHAQFPTRIIRGQ